MLIVPKETQMIDTTRRIDVVVLVEAIMSNPNIDPDNDGNPRIIERNGDKFAVISDSSIKRKIRDAAKEYHESTLYVDHGANLETTQAKYDRIENLLSDFWDSRVFGGVFPKYDKDGRLCSPINIPHAISLFPVRQVGLRMTRVAGYKQDEDKVKASQAKRAKAKFDDFEQSEGDKERAEAALRANMSDKKVIQHALFPIYLSFSPHLASKTGMTAKDLEIALDSVISCWEHSKSSSRPDIRFRRMTMFQHSSARGDTHAYKLRERLEVTLKKDVEEPCTYEDYLINLNLEGLPAGITVKDFDDNTTGITAEMLA